MIDLLRLCRLYYSVPISLAYTLTVCYAFGSEVAAAWRGTVLSTAALALIISAAYVFNDVCDRRADRINAPRRPVTAGRVQPVTATCWAACLLIAGMAVAAMCRWQFLGVLTAVAAGLVFYDLFSKRLDVGKQLLVAALMTSIYPLAFAQAGGAAGIRAPTLAVFPIWMFLTSFGYEGLKDVRDIRGDQSAAGRLTWIQRRPRLGRRLSLAAIVTGAAVLIGPYLVGCGWVYMAIAGFAMLAGVLSAFVPPRRALMLVYIECVIVGLAAAVDLIVLGV